MSPSIILFTNKECSACVGQNEILEDYAEKSGKPVEIYQIDINNPNPEIQKKIDKNFPWVEATPTWVINLEKNKYMVYEGVIEDQKMIKNIANQSRGTNFGQLNKLVQGINDLQINGKNFGNGSHGFNTPKSFYNEIESNWGTGSATLNAGLGSARSYGPGNADNVFSNNHFHQPRMVPPGSTDDVFLRANRLHNEMNNQNNNFYPGMLTGSGSPQIVDKTSGFGKRGPRFGSPAYKNNYLVDEGTGKHLFNGAQQFEGERPMGVFAPDTFIGNAPLYKPFKFGKKIKRRTKGKTVNISGRKAVNIKINIHSKNKG